MNRDQIAGNRKKVEGVVREKWGKLTDDDVDVIAGNHPLRGRIRHWFQNTHVRQDAT
jgi:uncharacterized protein YjbJ (UPF0337 family)